MAQSVDRYRQVCCCTYARAPATDLFSQELGLLVTSLTWLRLELNRLTSTIPSSFSRLTRLRTLYLLGLCWLGLIRRLVRLYFRCSAGNNLTGAIPPIAAPFDYYNATMYPSCALQGWIDGRSLSGNCLDVAKSSMCVTTPGIPPVSFCLWYVS